VWEAAQKQKEFQSIIFFPDEALVGGLPPPIIRKIDKDRIGN
jgi:hypothetical protein